MKNYLYLIKLYDNEKNTKHIIKSIIFGIIGFIAMLLITLSFLNLILSLIISLIALIYFITYDYQKMKKKYKVEKNQQIMAFPIFCLIYLANSKTNNNVLDAIGNSIVFINNKLLKEKLINLKNNSLEHPEKFKSYLDDIAYDLDDELVYSFNSFVLMTKNIGVDQANTIFFKQEIMKQYEQDTMKRLISLARPVRLYSKYNTFLFMLWFIFFIMLMFIITLSNVN